MPAMYKCSNCGSIMSEPRGTCPKCGVNLIYNGPAPATQTTFGLSKTEICQGCGKSRYKTEKVCPNCGFIVWGDHFLALIAGLMWLMISGGMTAMGIFLFLRGAEGSSLWLVLFMVVMVVLFLVSAVYLVNFFKNTRGIRRLHSEIHEKYIQSCPGQDHLGQL